MHSSKQQTEVHFHYGAAAARWRQATQASRAAAPACRRGRLANAAAHAARPRAVSAHAHHRRAANRTAPRLHLEHAHRHQPHAHTIRSVLARVVAHLHTRLASSRARRVAHDRVLARPRRATHRAADATRQQPERLRCLRKARAVHRQRRAALRERTRRRDEAHRRRSLVSEPRAACRVLLTVHRQQHRHATRRVHRR